MKTGNTEIIPEIKLVHMRLLRKGEKKEKDEKEVSATFLIVDKENLRRGKRTAWSIIRLAKKAVSKSYHDSLSVWGEKR